MKKVLTQIIFFCLMLFGMLCHAQEILPKGVSYYGQLAFNKPMNYTGTGTMSDQIKARYAGSASGSLGLLRSKKNVAFSPSIKYVYTSCKLERTLAFPGYTSIENISIKTGRLNAELTWYVKTGKNKNLLLGGGIFAGGCLTKKVNGTMEVWSSYPTTHFITNTINSYGNFQYGLLMDLKYVSARSAKKNHCVSAGIRILSGIGIYPQANGLLKGYKEFEVYASYNLWKAKKPIDSTRIKTAPVPERVIPIGNSYFVQGGYNRPFDSNRGYDHMNQKLRFKNSASVGIGINHVKNRIAYSALLKYTYTEGTDDYKDYGLGGGWEYHSHFYVGKISEEFMVHRVAGRNRKLFLGTGIFIGQNIFINNAGYSVSVGHSSNYPYTSITTEKLTADNFGKWNVGLIFDIKYSLRSYSKPNSCFTIGSRFMTGFSAPYPFGFLGLNVLSQQEAEVYISYNFWKKKKPTIEETKEPIGTTRIGKLKRWGKK